MQVRPRLLVLRVNLIYCLTAEAWTAPSGGPADAPNSVQAVANLNALCHKIIGRLNQAQTVRHALGLSIQDE
jgi:hypothetical protein